jgi:hypothetical protein
LFGDEQVSVAGQDQRRYANAVQSRGHIEPLNEPETMGHDALIGLPALPSDELEERPRPLSAAEEQVEELIDKGIIRGQRIPREDEAGHRLKQTMLETGADALHSERAEPAGKPGCEFQAQDPAERDAQQGGTLKAMPVEDFCQILNKVP